MNKNPELNNHPEYEYIDFPELNNEAILEALKSRANNEKNTIKVLLFLMILYNKSEFF